MRPGDPAGVERHWNGKQWQCEIRGPIRDRFDRLRSVPFDALSPDDQQQLRRLTSEVSAIEDLVLAAPSENPPLIEVEAPRAYVPPPVDTYGLPQRPPVPPGVSAYAMHPGPARDTRKRSSKVVGIVAAVVVTVLMIGVRVAFLVIPAATGTASLAMNSCVTLSYPSTGTDSQDVTWTKAECSTSSGGPVSYTVYAVLPGEGTCDKDSQFIQTYTANKSVKSTYCLMENIAFGQCLYEDDRGFMYDVACDDPRAAAKVVARADQGSGYACPGTDEAWAFPSANRTYCVGRP